jgi:hypothetical protein
MPRTMTENPYAAPNAALTDSPGEAAGPPIRMYSPTQVACGTLGGPIGLIHFLHANFVALGQARRARLTLVYGALGLLGLLILLPILPDKFPSSPFTIAYILIARQVAENMQMTKAAIAASPHHTFHSGWRVFGLGMLCLLASLLVLGGWFVLLVALGLLKP